MTKKKKRILCSCRRIRHKKSLHFFFFFFKLMRTFANFGEAYQVTGYLMKASTPEEDNYLLSSMGYSPKKYNVYFSSDRVTDDIRNVNIRFRKKDESEQYLFCTSFSLCHEWQKENNEIAKCLFQKIKEMKPVKFVKWPDGEWNRC